MENSTDSYPLLQPSFNRDKGYTIALSIVYCIITALNAPLNVMVIHHILKQKMLNPSHLFVLSLSVSNLLNMLPMILFPIRMHVPFSETLVRTNIVLSTWPAFATNQSAMLTVLFIACDRLLAVARPLSYRIIMTTRLALTMICLAWVYSLVATGVAVVYYGLQTPVEVVAGHLLTLSQWIPGGFWLAFTYVICGSVLATTFIYALIFIILKKSKMEQSSVRTKRITRTTGLMVAMVIITWLPLHLFGYVVPCCPEYYEAVYYSLHALLTTNTVVTPIIFLRQNKRSHWFSVRCCRKKNDVRPLPLTVCLVVGL